MALETGHLIREHFEQLKLHRGNFESLWSDVADDVLGMRSFNEKHSPGRSRMTRIYDTTGMAAGYLLASTINGMITNPGARFHQTIVPKGAREIGQNNDYLVHVDEVLDSLYKDAKYGFPTAATEFWIDYVFFGTAGMFTADVPGIGPVDSARPLGELVVDTASNGMIDTCYRHYSLTPRQFVQEFGPEADPATTKAAERPSGAEIEMIHVSHPRTDITSGPLQFGPEFRSAHIMRAGKGDILRDRGFSSDPWQIARWGVDAGEMYGRGPGIQALSDCQTASEVARIILETGQKHLDPALLVPDDGIISQIDTSPRALVAYRAGAFDKDGIRAFPMGDGSPITQTALQHTQEQIQQRFYGHLLQLFDGASTATAILEMETKAARILVSMVSRASAEFASKSLRRKFDVAQRNGMFDAPPPTMVGVPMQIRYLSPIMKTQRQMETRATLNTYAAAAQMVQAGAPPDVMDNFRHDELLREIAAAEGMDLAGLESVDLRDMVREMRAKQEARQQQLDQLSQGAEAVGKALPALAQAQQDQGGTPLAA